MSLFEGVTIALDSLRANSVRAALTILGVAVGVFVVVVISAAIHGINASVAKDFEKAGPTTFFAEPVSDHVRGVRRHGRHVQVAPQSAAHVRRREGARARCRRFAPPARRWISQREVRYKDRDLSSSDAVIGTTANWTIDRRRRRSLSRPQLHRVGGDERRARRRSSTTRWRRRLFGDSDPLDKVDRDRRTCRSR